MHFFNGSYLFQNLLKEAKHSLILLETTSATSMGAKRVHYVYSNVPHYKKGALEIIISEATQTDDGKIYYQLDVIEHH